MITESIMVVDDDQDLRDSVVEILEDNGYTVIACETAEAALEKLAETVPRLVLVDNMMPGLGGMALIPLLKKDYPGTKIIMITAFSTVDNAVAAMKSGADDYLTKPFRRDDLLMAVRRMLEMVKFGRQHVDTNMDEALTCLANPIRRQILAALSENGEMRFMDITRTLRINDHTKVGFHLKLLKTSNLVSQNREKIYHLTPQGKKIIDCLHLLTLQISS
jgi:DNA-binding response OmpR family regulator